MATCVHLIVVSRWNGRLVFAIVARILECGKRSTLAHWRLINNHTKALVLTYTREIIKKTVFAVANRAIFNTIQCDIYVIGANSAQRLFGNEQCRSLLFGTQRLAKLDINVPCCLGGITSAITWELIGFKLMADRSFSVFFRVYLR